MRLVSLAVVAILAARLEGATVTWTGYYGGAWSNAANWSSGTVPTAADDVIFPAGTPHSIVVDVNGETNSITVKDQYSFDSSGVGDRIFTSDVTVTHGGTTPVYFRVRVALNGNSVWNIGNVSITRALEAGPHQLNITGAGTIELYDLTGTGAVQVAGPTFRLAKANFSGTIEADDFETFSSGEAPLTTVLAKRVDAKGNFKRLTVTESLTGAGVLRAEEIAITGGASPATFVYAGLNSIIYPTSMTLSNAELTFGSFTPKVGRSYWLVYGDAQPVNGTFNGLPQGATFAGNGHQYTISYTEGTNATDVKLLWKGAEGVRAWTGAVDGLWSRAENWWPEGIREAGEPLIFTENATEREMTNDLPPLVLGPLSFPTDVLDPPYEIGGNLLLLGEGTTGAATINAPVELHASQTIEATLNSSLDVGGHTVVMRGAHNGELIGTGTVRWSRFGILTLAWPANPFSGRIQAWSPYSSVTIGGSYPNASFDGWETFKVEGEQTIGDLKLQNLRLNHPAGPAHGLLHTGSITFEFYPQPVPLGFPPTWNLDLDADAADQVDVTGTVSIPAQTYLELSVHETLTVGRVYTIVKNDGTDAVSGTFSGANEHSFAGEGALLSADGHIFRISYVGGDGNDVTLTVTSSPGGALLVSGQSTNAFERNSGTTNAEIVFVLNRTAPSDVTVTYHTEDRTARAGEDYVAKSGTFVFPAGITGVILNVALVGDTTPEPNETFAIVLDAVSEGSIVQPTIIVGILNDDAGTLTGQDVSAMEGDLVSTTVAVTLSSSSPAVQSHVVQYHTENGTAVAGVDYSAATGSVVIPAGASSALIELTILSDGEAESDEEFTLVIDSASGLEIVRPRIAVTIMDDDPVFTRVPGIAYATSGRTLDLLLPPGNTRTIPAVVAFVDAGDEPIVAKQTARGYAVAVVSVRNTYPENLQDASAAIEWMRTHGSEYGIDRTRLLAWGIDSGGTLAALLGTNAVDGASRVDGVIDFYGEVDYVDLDAHPGACGIDYTSRFGCDPAVCSDIARSASPITHVSPGDAPFLIVHATGDCVVPISQSVRLHQALQSARVRSELIAVPGNRGPNVVSREVLESVDAFIDDVLTRGRRQRAVRH